MTIVPDLSKAVIYTLAPSFLNSATYTGSLVISGNVVGGINSRSVNISLPEDTDITDIKYSTNGSTWFDADTKVVVPYTSTMLGDTYWSITSKFTGTTLTITIYYAQQFTGSQAINSTTLQIKIIDYVSS